MEEAGWLHGTPGREYPERRCLGMALADAGSDMRRVEQRILELFPERASGERPLLPMFECCGSTIIPAFNNHPDTTFEDIQLVQA